MATAKKLPSGNFRVRVYTGASANGKKIYKSFTAPTKKEAELLALAYEKRTETNLTFKEALSDYIESKERVLSPSTIREYKRLQERHFAGFEDYCIDSISQKDIQKFINDYAKTHSPKSCRNIHGLISAVLRMYRPEFNPTTTLPQKEMPNYKLPSEEEVKLLLDYFEKKNPKMHDAVLLAAIVPMRRSEICALTSEDITGNVIHIHRAVVKDAYGNWKTKTTKSIAGDRFVPLPDIVLQRFEGRSGRLVEMTPNEITQRFCEARTVLNLPQFRFHDLRHYGASIQHAMGIPDAYIMQRGGWKSDKVLKQVYRHTMEAEQKAVNDKINERFSEMYDTKYDTENKKPPI